MIAQLSGESARLGRSRQALSGRESGSVQDPRTGLVPGIGRAPVGSERSLTTVHQLGEAGRVWRDRRNAEGDNCKDEGAEESGDRGSAKHTEGNDQRPDPGGHGQSKDG